LGYQRAVYSPDTWTWAIRPIIDKAIGRWYFFTSVVSGGLAYYADYGRLGEFAPLHDQQQQVFAVTDLNVSPQWEINLGVGIGATAATEHLIVKAILGRRFDWGRHAAVD
jgi:hypothetical protein